MKSSELACQQGVLHRLPTLRQAVASDMSQVEGPPEAGARTSHGSWLLPLLVTQGARRAGRREQASRQNPPRQMLTTDNNESPAPSPSPELEPPFMASTTAEGSPSQEHIKMVESLLQGPLGADGTSHTSLKLESKSLSWEA